MIRRALCALGRHDHVARRWQRNGQYADRVCEHCGHVLTPRAWKRDRSIHLHDDGRNELRRVVDRLNRHDP